MKAKKFHKKLVLNKETISTLSPRVTSLSDEEKEKMVGGITGRWCSQNYSCDEFCTSLNTLCTDVCSWYC